MSRRYCGRCIAAASLLLIAVVVAANATGLDVAGKMIEFLEKNAKPWKTRTKGKG